MKKNRRGVCGRCGRRRYVKYMKEMDYNLYKEVHATNNLFCVREVNRHKEIDCYNDIIKITIKQLENKLKRIKKLSKLE